MAEPRSEREIEAESALALIQAIVESDAMTPGIRPPRELRDRILAVTSGYWEKAIQYDTAQ